MSLPEIETSLTIDAHFDENGEPRVEVLARIGRHGRGWLELPVTAAIARLEREGVADATIAKVAGDAGRLRMAIVDAILARREVLR